MRATRTHTASHRIANRGAGVGWWGGPRQQRRRHAVQHTARSHFYFVHPLPGLRVCTVQEIHIFGALFGVYLPQIRIARPAHNWRTTHCSYKYSSHAQYARVRVRGHRHSINIVRAVHWHRSGANFSQPKTHMRRHHSRTLTYNSIIQPFIYTCTHGWRVSPNSAAKPPLLLCNIAGLEVRRYTLLFIRIINRNRSFCLWHFSHELGAHRIICRPGRLVKGTPHVCCPFNPLMVRV